MKKRVELYIYLFHNVKFHCSHMTVCVNICQKAAIFCLSIPLNWWLTVALCANIIWLAWALIWLPSEFTCPSISARLFSTWIKVYSEDIKKTYAYNMCCACVLYVEWNVYMATRCCTWSLQHYKYGFHIDYLPLHASPGTNIEITTRNNDTAQQWR